MAHRNSCKNVINMEHTASAVLLFFGWFCRAGREEFFHGLVNCIVFTNFQHTKLCFFQNLSLGFIKYS